MKIGSIEITSSRVIVALVVLVQIQGAIGRGDVSLAHMFPARWIDGIVAWHSFLAYVGMAIIGAVAAPGAFGRVSTLSVPPIVKAAIVVAFALSFLVAGGSAQAAQMQFTGNAIADAKANAARLKAAASPTAPGASDALTDLMNKITKVQNQVVTDAVTDINAADAAAAALTNPSDASSFADPIAHACYPALVKFLQGLPVATAPTGTLQVAQIFEKKRLFVIQIQAGLPVSLKLGCAALVGDEVQIFIKAMGLVGVTVSTAGLGGIIPTAGALSGLAL